MTDRLVSDRQPQQGEFMECDTCRALPGTPPLCRGCLHNRALITRLQQALNPDRKD